MAKKTVKKSAKKPAAKPPKTTTRARISKAPASGKGTPERRADFGAEVTTYFKSLPAAQQPIALAVHKALLSAAPSLEHTVKWGIAQYLFPGSRMKDAEGFAIYATSKSVNLAVGRGGELAKKHPQLEGTGKSMRHVKLRSVADATSVAVAAIIKDAVAMTRGA